MKVKKNTKQQIKPSKEALKSKIYRFFYSNGKTESPQNRIVLISTFLMMFLGVWFFYVFYADFEEFNNANMGTTLGMVFMYVAAVLFAYRVILFIYMAYNYLKYKPIESVTNDELPTVTVIVPAYNEGKQVWDTLMSLAKSNYPEGKMQLLAIDDGSLDDTWEWMENAKEKLGDRLDIYKQPDNKGKRHALYRGFHLGTGEIFVTVDSDSIVTEDTLRNLVSPFLIDENCGAVAGNIRVLNNTKEILPKMLDVSFY